MLAQLLVQFQKPIPVPAVNNTFLTMTTTIQPFLTDNLNFTNHRSIRSYADGLLHEHIDESKLNLYAPDNSIGML